MSELMVYGAPGPHTVCGGDGGLMTMGTYGKPRFVSAAQTTALGVNAWIGNFKPYNVNNPRRTLRQGVTVRVSTRHQARLRQPHRHPIGGEYTVDTRHEIDARCACGI